MKTKNKIVLTTILLLLVMATVLTVVPEASAAAKVFLKSPKAGNNYTTTINFTANVSGLNPKSSFNVSLICDASGGKVTAADTWVKTVSNSTPNQNVTYASTSITSVTDALAYNCSVFLDNASTAGQQWATAAMKITFDSTVPVCSMEALSNRIPYKGVIDLKWSATDALSLKTASTTIDGPQDQTTVTDTTAVTTRTLTSQETKYIGDWTVTLTGTDKAGNTCTASDTFKSYMPDGPGTPGYEEETTTGIGSLFQNKTLLLIVVIVAIYFLFFNKKK